MPGLRIARGQCIEGYGGKNPTTRCWRRWVSCVGVPTETQSSKLWPRKRLPATNATAVAIERDFASIFRLWLPMDLHQSGADPG